MVMFNRFKNLLTAAILMATSGCRTTSLADNNKIQQDMTLPTFQLSTQHELSSLSNASGWLNTKPLKSADLKGKVVLINFCTYSCINWIRTLPYVRSWAAKYQDRGLVVIGVHTPEFGFEQNIENVRSAIKDRKVDYPIALDNDYTIWNAFNNAYWPALYFIDAKGQLRHQQFGEGGYEQSEKIIQQLLAEAGVKDMDQPLASVYGEGAEAAADWNSLQSGENYLGYERTQQFSSPGNARPGRNYSYKAPEKLMLNEWALSGDWKMKKQSIELNTANGRILYRFHARDLHLVMGAGTHTTLVKFRVLIDGKPPAAAHGSDIDEQGYGVLSEHRLYQLIRQPDSIIDRQFEIEFFGSGVEAFAFTFG